ncbi:MAG: peptide/nickel transport system ATP-binding protein [Gaiellales bacterium]|nr:peptide/nickel transport system ATP-binding protein [Gaiellales bacterium]
MIAIRDLQGAFGPRVVAHIPELEIGRGEIVGLAGESGSGKSMTALAILGLARFAGAHVTGSIALEGRELLALGDRQLRHVRGRRIAMIMQSPRAALNPTLRLGQLFERTLLLHGVARSELHARTVDGMQSVLLDPALLERYPHQISGGQAQRFGIALALALHADVLLADEPTSALDVTVQAEVVALLRRVRDERGTAMLFISHDLAVIGQLADRVVIMRRGEVVEVGGARQVLVSPSAEYTRELIAAVPRIRPPA